jgi:hypothetical protein
MPLDGKIEPLRIPSGIGVIMQHQMILILVVYILKRKEKIP